MLIDRMADHPEEFHGYGRFSAYLGLALVPEHTAERAHSGMTDEDAEAIRQAWTKVNAPKFTEEIIKIIMSPPKEEFTEAMRLDSSGQLGIGNHQSRFGTGWVDPKSLYGHPAINPAQNAISPYQNQLALQGLQLSNITVSKPEEQPKGFFARIVDKAGF
jgi:hypothetical protein